MKLNHNNCNLPLLRYTPYTFIYSSSKGFLLLK